MPAESTSLETETVCDVERANSFWARLNFFSRSAAKSRSENREEAPIQPLNPGKGKSIFRRSFFPARGKKLGTGSKPVKTLIQSELSLETVRVVRNDLCDTDLEIVTCLRQSEATVTRAVPTEVKPAIPAPEESEFAKAAAQPGWSRLTARLFDTGGIGRG